MSTPVDRLPATRTPTPQRRRGPAADADGRARRCWSLAAVVYVATLGQRRRAGLRQRRRRGVDGGRDRRLVRGDRAVPAPAGPADPAHRADPAAQGRAGPRPAGLRRRELPPGGDRPRADRRGRGLGAGRRLAGRRRPTPGGSSTRSPRWPCIALGKVRDEHIESLVTDALVPRFREEPISPLLGGLLAEALRDDLHHGLVDLALEELHDWLAENPRTVQDVDRGAGAVVGARQPQRAGHRPRAPRDRPLGRRHPARPRTTGPAWRSTRCWRQLADDLLTDPDDPGARRAAQGPAARPPGRHLDRDLAVERAAPRPVGVAGATPSGAVRRRLLTEVHAFAARLADDAALRARLDAPAADAVVFVVERYGSELTGGHHPHDRALGRPRGRRPDRAARRSRPAVHPDQRHDRRRPGRRR